jgi:hypothetical protein
MIKVWVPDSRSLQSILGAARVSLECGAPKRDGDDYVVVLYGTAAEANKVAALGFKHEIDTTFGNVLAERVNEVSKTDRFRGGAVKFEGLGVKRKG